MGLGSIYLGRGAVALIRRSADGTLLYSALLYCCLCYDMTSRYHFVLHLLAFPTSKDGTDNFCIPPEFESGGALRGHAQDHLVLYGRMRLLSLPNNGIE